MAKQHKPSHADRTASDAGASVLADLLSAVRDPYLADSLGEFLRLAGQLYRRTGRKEAAQIVRDAFFLCEVSRDATMRFLPYMPEHAEVLRAAAAEYRRVVNHLRAFDLSPDEASKVAMYADHIQERVAEYDDAVAKVGDLTAAALGGWDDSR
jgi:hypothetical protein